MSPLRVSIRCIKWSAVRLLDSISIVTQIPVICTRLFSGLKIDYLPNSKAGYHNLLERTRPLSLEEELAEIYLVLEHSTWDEVHQGRLFLG